MTPQQAQELADRALAVIDYWEVANSANPDPHVADRERVASDLAGLRQHVPHAVASGECAWCECAPYPCADATRYAAGLIRTARLYGVETPDAL